MNWSKEQPLQIAVVGSGPSGFYAAEALLKQKEIPVQVDVFDRLPTPYGLVRGGVAPDHQKIKSVIAVYEKVATSPGFRFFGNVELGKDISAQDLERYYDKIVYAVGNESDRHLGVPGEDLKGSYSATSFVGWYNGHPHHHDNQFDLSVERAVVFGIGNVAMDVTRLLAVDPEELAKTDIADYALEALRRSRVKEIHLFGRRGPAQAAFSPAEIQEIASLGASDLIVNPQDMVLDDSSKTELTDPVVKKNVEFLTGISKKSPGSKGKKIFLHFLASPIEIFGKNGHVDSVKIEKNSLVSDGEGGYKAKGTGRFETFSAGLVLRSVGYRGVPIPGVPFDDKKGNVLNQNGRVLDPKTSIPLPGRYTVGWAKRGPSGLIGTNRSDSIATVQLMLEDSKKFPPTEKIARGPEEFPRLLRDRNIRYVSFQDWKVLDRLEVERGAKAGKIREKFTRVEHMLDALANAPKAAAS